MIALSLNSKDKGRTRLQPNFIEFAAAPRPGQAKPWNLSGWEIVIVSLLVGGGIAFGAVTSRGGAPPLSPPPPSPPTSTSPPLPAFNLSTFKRSEDLNAWMQMWVFGIYEGKAFVVAIQREGDEYRLGQPNINCTREHSDATLDQCDAGVSCDQLKNPWNTLLTLHEHADSLIFKTTGNSTVLAIYATGKAEVRPYEEATSLVEISFFGPQYSFSFTNGTYVHAMGKIQDNGWGGIEYSRSKYYWGDTYSPLGLKLYSNWFMFYDTENGDYGFVTVPTPEGERQGWGFAYSGRAGVATERNLALNFTASECGVEIDDLMHRGSNTALTLPFMLLNESTTQWRVAMNGTTLAWWEKNSY